MVFSDLLCADTSVLLIYRLEKKEMLKQIREIFEANILPFVLGMIFGMFVVLVRIS